jgi:outer membrane lipoprotein-sorting protein
MKIQMNFLLLSFGLLSIESTSFAQESKSVMLSDQSKVVFNSPDSKRLDGPYVVSNNDKVFLRGVYKNDVRAGNWYAFNENEKLFMRYNYDLKKILFVDTTSIGRLNINIDSSDPVVKEKASIPVPISSIDQYVSLLGTELKRIILKDNKNAQGALTADLVTSIDKSGKPSYYATYPADGVLVKTRLFITEKNFDLQWIPASYNGETYASSFSVKAKIDFGQKIPGRQRFQWVY